ncbi:MAG TPA: protein kinase [Longimicrobiaceae bacterium]
MTLDPLRWELVRARFDELVDLPEGERSSRLRELRAQDPELGGAVHSLLTADESAGSDLADLDDALLVPGAPDPWSPEAPAEPGDALGLSGRTISHYRVIGALGAGGMGFVYRAEDTRLHRTVALKFLLPQLSLDDAARERFLQEARSAGSLDHPNLCTIHAVEEADAGRLFLAMPLYPGETLKARIARVGPLPIDQALDIARQIARGLVCAHEAGIVHRDLKPGNIMLLPDGMVKILDFGLAKARDATLSAADGTVGTLAYMAPEQLLHQPVDARSDLWALGVVLYEMLTGTRPFPGDRDHEIASAVVHGRVSEPSRQREEIPAAVDDLVLTLLQKKPARRLSSAAEALAELGRLSSGTREDSIPSSGWKREALLLLPSRALRRPLQLTAAIVIALALVLVGGMIGRALLATAPAVPSIAVLPLDNPGGSVDESLASGLQLEIITSLGSASGLQVISSQSVREYAGSTAPADEIGASLGADFVLSGSTQRYGHQIRVALQLTDASTNRNLWSDRYETSDTADLFQLQTRVAQSVADALRVRLTAGERARLSRLPTSNTRAYNLYVRGQEYEARGTARDQRIAASLYQEAVALDANFALAYARKSIVDGRIFRVSESPDRWSPQQAERSRQAAEMAMRLRPDLPEAHLARGYYLYHVHSDYGGALEAFETALRAMPNDADAHAALADVYRRMGRWEEAVSELRRAMELDPRDPERARNLAATYRQMRRYPEAIQALDRAIQLAPDLYGHRETRARIMVGWLGTPDSLAAVLRHAPADWLTSSDAAAVRVDLAGLQRRPADALVAFASLTPELMDARLADGSTDLHQLRARAYALAGDTLRARLDHQTVRETLEAALRVRPDDPHTHADLALAYAGLGLKERAIEEANLAMRLLPMERDAWEGDVYVAHAAETFARIGEVDAAIDLLEKMLDAPTLIGPHILRLEPRWDPLRGSPRFRALLRRE